MVILHVSIFYIASQRLKTPISYLSSIPFLHNELDLVAIMDEVV